MAIFVFFFTSMASQIPEVKHNYTLVLVLQQSFFKYHSVFVLNLAINSTVKLESLAHSFCVLIFFKTEFCPDLPQTFLLLMPCLWKKFCKILTHHQSQLYLEAQNSL